jgi:hypothetical protein
MADPLSVGASIVGILSAAGKISELLEAVISSAKEAPQFIANLKFEVDDVRAAFWSFKGLIALLETAPSHRTALVPLDQLVITLTETVITFSKLADTINPLIVPEGQKIPLRTRLKWTRAEGNCKNLMEKLQRLKTSVSLMLNILQWCVISKAHLLEAR